MEKRKKQSIFVIENENKKNISSDCNCYWKISKSSNETDEINSFCYDQYGCKKKKVYQDRKNAETSLFVLLKMTYNEISCHISKCCKLEFDQLFII